jgi:SOS-response transcriptional repressor LexA
MTLTPREKKVLIFLRAHVARYGVAPSYREVCAATGIRSTSNVAYIIDTLAAHKFIKRVGSARRVELLQTEDYHLPNCDCDGCARARYLVDLKLVQALQVGPEISLARKLVGLRPLSHLARIDFAYRDNSRVRRKPLLGATQAAKNTLNQISVGVR